MTGFRVLIAALGALIFGLLIGVMFAPAVKAGTWWDNPAIRACCSEADAVYADEWSAMPDGSIKAKVTGGGPRNHAWAPINRVYIVPPDKVRHEPGNPTGRAILFLNPSNLDWVHCFAMGPMI